MKKNFKRVVLFALIVTLCVGMVGKIFKSGSAQGKNSQAWEGFYAEGRNSLDGVYIGASHVYTFWMGLPIWEKYGYKIYGLSTSGMPSAAIPYVLEEGYKNPARGYIYN